MNPNPGLKLRNSQWICHFQGGCGGSPNSTHKNMPDRLDKSCSALAEARLKIHDLLQYTNFCLFILWITLFYSVLSDLILAWWKVSLILAYWVEICERQIPFCFIQGIVCKNSKYCFELHNVLYIFWKHLFAKSEKQTTKVYTRNRAFMFFPGLASLWCNLI